MSAALPDNNPTTTFGVEVQRGIVAMAPLLLGVAPFAAALAVTARVAGFSPLETQALSMIVFAGSAQLATITLAASGSGAAQIVLTALLLNLRHVLYGLSLGSRLRHDRRPTWPVVAFFLTDEAYGVTIRDLVLGRSSRAFLLGASLTLYVVFATFTLLGSLVGALLPRPGELGLDFVFPVSFLALLVPLLRTRVDLAVALAAGGGALALSQLINGGTAVLVATIGGATLGVAWDEWSHRERP